MRKSMLVLFLIIGGCASSKTEILERGDRWPNANPTFCITSYGNVYVPNGHLRDYTVEPLAPHDRALLNHELVHADRQRELHVFWHIFYELCDSFRWDEEKLGYLAHFKSLKEQGRVIDEEWFLTVITDPFYGGMVNREDAKRWLDTIK